MYQSHFSLLAYKTTSLTKDLKQPKTYSKNETLVLLQDELKRVTAGAENAQPKVSNLK